MAALLVLQGCASPGPGPQVVEPGGSTTPSPSPQSVEMVRALNELNALKEELKLLRNRVEEIQFSQENADRRQQDLFQDVDRRLTGLERSEQDILARLEGAPAGALPGETTSSENPLAEPGVEATGQTGSGVAPSTIGSGTVETNQPPGSSVGQVNTVTVGNSRAISDGQQAGDGTSSVSLSEQDAYDAAFESLKQSRYQDAIQQFQALVNTWPQSELADDSLYWMSEANYVNREFEAALNGFRDLVQRYPDSSRLPEAMLKVGYIQYDIGAYDQAAKTFEDILARFPGHQVTVSAETRLRRIKQTIQ